MRASLRPLLRGFELFFRDYSKSDDYGVGYFWNEQRYNNHDGINKFVAVGICIMVALTYSTFSGFYAPRWWILCSSLLWF